MASVTGSLNIEWMSFFWQRASSRSKSSRLGGPTALSGTAGRLRRPSAAPRPLPPGSEAKSSSVPAVSAAAAPPPPVRASEGAGPADRPSPVDEGAAAAAAAFSAACVLQAGRGAGGRAVNQGGHPNAAATAGRSCG